MLYMNDMGTETLKNTNPDNNMKIGEKPFSGIVTIDPKHSVDSWEKLSQGTWALEIGLLPVILHKSLIRTIKASQLLARR